MKVRFKASDKFEVECEGDTHQALWEEMASVGEVLGYSECGACKSTDIRPVVRHVEKEEGKKKKEYKYYEMHCTKCRARLSFGCHQEGGSLFPKKKDDEGGWLPNNGWTKYDPAAKKAD